MKTRILTAAILSALAFPIAAHAAATRTHVSNAGSDANATFSCDYANPCRTFAAALAVTTPGGEILAIDSSGYGKVVIDRSVSIIAAPGVFAGIGVGSGNGVTIATAGVNVVLRGLTINNMGSSGDGIHMDAGDSLVVQNCVIANFAVSSSSGLFVAGTMRVRLLDSLLQGNYIGASFSGGPKVLVSGSRFLDSGTHGLYASATGAGVVTRVEVIRSEASGNVNVGFYPTASDSARAELNLKDSVASRNSNGVNALASGGTALARVSNSLISGNTSYGLRGAGSGAKLVAAGNRVTDNGIGLFQTASGVLQSTGDNTLSDNGLATSGTITSLPNM